MLSLTALVLSACGGGSSHHSTAPAEPPAAANPADENLVSQPIVISHRGASGYLPEHTLAAYELAILMGVDYIEPDLQFTSDGVLVAMHDDTLDQNTDVATKFAPRNGHTDYPVSDFTLAEIKTLTVTYSDSGTAQTSYPGFTPTDGSFTIPTFEEVIQFAKEQTVKQGRPIGIYPEAKQADPDMEDGILSTLAAYKMNTADNPVYIQSFSYDTIKSIHAKQQAQGTTIPLIVLGLAVTEGSTAKMGIWGTSIEAVDLAEIAKVAKGIGVMIGYPAYPVTRSFIEQAHAAGLKVHGWTFNKADAIAAQKEYREYLDIGMDGMFSNYPDLALMARDQFNTATKFTPDVDPDAPIVISHRGASGYLPEHTFAAYELAIMQGADYIEPDLQFTSDGELVAMHDDTLEGNTNVVDVFGAPRNGHTNYPVSDFTLAEIKQLTVTNSDSGTDETSYPGFTPTDGSFTVPTFQEVIDFAKAQSAKHGRKIGIYPEAKQGDQTMADTILATLAANDLSSTPPIIQSFSADTIQYIHDQLVAQGKSYPLIVLGYPIMDNGVAKACVALNYATLSCTRSLTMSEVAAFATGVGMMIGGDAYGLTMPKEFFDQAHAAGLKVHGWTFNKANAITAAEEYQKYLALGMDGYFSNYPNLGVKARDWYLQQKQ
jgi:glycerophosphoryl diester phosphodiesterase